jgi:hypothetical protein
MGIVYQLTFFLALGLLAIVVTVFVFAVSLLGRALEAAAKSERVKLAERRKNNAKEMAAIRKEIREAERKGQIPKGLRRKLQKLEERDKKFEKELGKIRKAPGLLTVRGGVVPCASGLLGALILSGGAWYLSDIQISIEIIPVLIWVLGLAAIGYTMSHIYKCLKVIESVAITSEQAALARETEALRRTFRELEEEKKPKLALKFIDAQPPFNMEAQSEITIKFGLSCDKGNIAKSTAVFFEAPLGFEFPSRASWSRSARDKYHPNYVITSIELEAVRKGLLKIGTLELKAPSHPEHYTAFYRLICEGFDSGLKEFDIIVE